MPRRLRILALAGFAAAVLTARGEAPAGAGLPLPENYFPALKTMLATAARRSPRMVTRDLNEALAEGNRIIARAGLLPSAGGNFRYLPWDRDYRVADPRSPYTSEKIAYAVNLTQPLYHWGALESTARIAELQSKITRGETTETYRQLANEIRRQFLQLIVKKADLARTRTGQKRAEEQLQLAQENLDRHAISDADMFTPQMAADQARLATDRAVDDYDSSRLLLGKFVGTGPVGDDQVPDAIPEIPATPERLKPYLDDYANTAEPGAYLLRTVKDQIEVEKLNYRVASARLRPSVDLVLGSTQDEQSYTANIGAKYGVTSYFAGIGVSWSLFDGRATKGIKINTLARRRELERRYQQISGDLLDDARAKYRQLEFAARSLDLEERQLVRRDQDLDRVKDRLARGLASEADVRNAEFARGGDQVDVYRARSDYLTRAADFLGSVLQDPVSANLPASPP
ncbi:MAG TPA: TolC family protein [Opitutus sp.]|nr:TolC family protein [Opitutus sp.]